MTQLKEGVARFYQNLTDSEKTQYQELAQKQTPHTLFITCSDSRILPHQITSAAPGELFVYRTIGNQICDVGEDQELSKQATLEFAIEHLKVKNIVVCGHSDCGAMKALLNSAGIPSGSALSNWIKNTTPLAEAFHQGRKALTNADSLSQYNVFEQIKRIESLPFVKKRLDSGELSVHAWWFEIGPACVWEGDSSKEKFEKVES